MRFVAVAAGVPITAAVIVVLLRSRLARRVVAAPRHDRWHEQATPESCSKLVDDIKARGGAAVSGCHLMVEK